VIPRLLVLSGAALPWDGKISRDVERKTRVSLRWQLHAASSLGQTSPARSFRVYFSFFFPRLATPRLLFCVIMIADL